jgi:radical SAM protein with 4Fe4S-binding SPASM domain
MLPFVSPYLRPFLENGALRIDNGITSGVETLTPLQADVLRALWDPAKARANLEALFADAEDDEPILDALAQLNAAALVFEDEAACEAIYDRALDAAVQPLPFIDQVELTNICPMKCQFCPRGIDGRIKRPTGMMSLELFRRLLSQMHPAQGHYRPLELHHLGESLVHPDVARFVALATERGLPTEMSVNPSHLSPTHARDLLDAGLRRIIVSLDGMDKETLAAIRGKAAKWEKAEPNLDHLLSLVAKMPDPPKVVIQMIDLARNRHQRDAFLRRWGTTGLPTVTAFIKQLDGTDPDTGQMNAAPLTYLCSYPWRSVVVLWDGRVVPCCRDDDAHLVLGDLNHQSLREIWLGEPVRALREAHRQKQLAAGHLCADCAWRRERFAAAMPTRHPDLARPDPLKW